MKKNLLAVAVAGTLATPMFAMAMEDAPNEHRWYGRVNVGVDFSKANDVSNTKVVDMGSRFGVQGSQDLGNGLSAVYRFEFRVNGAQGSIVTGDEQRLSYAGLKGGFGQIIIGSLWSAGQNFLNTYLDPLMWLGNVAANAEGRLNKAVSYSNNFGPIAVQLDVQMDGDNPNSSSTDDIILGVGYSGGPVTVAASFEKEDGGAGPDKDVGGLAGKFNFGSLYVNGGIIEVKENNVKDSGFALFLGGGEGKFKWIVGYADWEETSSVIGTLSWFFSGTSRAYIEFRKDDDAVLGDPSDYVFGFRKDF